MKSGQVCVSCDARDKESGLGFLSFLTLKNGRHISLDLSILRKNQSFAYFLQDLLI